MFDHLGSEWRHRAFDVLKAKPLDEQLPKFKVLKSI